MYQKQLSKWFSYLLILCFGYVPLAACSKEPPSKQPKDHFSYTLSIDEKGMPVVSANGRHIPATRVEAPLVAKKIVRVRTMSIMDVEGSHFILIELGGSLYRIDLPD